ncbi:GNAT family N-acetyltransferase [soil metagenome]
MDCLESERLRMVAATLQHIRTELDAPEKLAALLDASVSPEWPPGEYDRDAMEFFRARFELEGEAAEGWYGWYVVRSGETPGVRALVAHCGYFGPPGADGRVEIGYSVLPAWQRRGYASEIVQMLLDNAFEFPAVQQVVAHAAIGNVGSISVLQACGFQADGPGQEADTLRFVVERDPSRP